jgi:hypothetical protein
VPLYVGAAALVLLLSCRSSRDGDVRVAASAPKATVLSCQRDELSGELEVRLRFTLPDALGDFPVDATPDNGTVPQVTAILDEGEVLVGSSFYSMQQGPKLSLQVQVEGRPLAIRLGHPSIALGGETVVKAETVEDLTGANFDLGIANGSVDGVRASKDGVALGLSWTVPDLPEDWSFQGVDRAELEADDASVSGAGIIAQNPAGAGRLAQVIQLLPEKIGGGSLRGDSGPARLELAKVTLIYEKSVEVDLGSQCAAP